MCATKSCEIARFHHLAMERFRSWARLACCHGSSPSNFTAPAVFVYDLYICTCSSSDKSLSLVFSCCKNVTAKLNRQIFIAFDRQCQLSLWSQLKSLMLTEYALGKPHEDCQFVCLCFSLCFVVKSYFHSSASCVQWCNCVVFGGVVLARPQVPPAVVWIVKSTLVSVFIQPSH